MRRWDPLITRQLAVLQRVASGEDLSDDADIPERRSAGALRDRGLVDISRRDGHWRARITDAGRFYIEHGCHPDHPAAQATPGNDRSKEASVNPRAEASTPGRTSGVRRVAAAERVSDGKRPPPHTTARIAEQRQLAVRTLVADLVANGHIVIAKPDEDTVAEYRRVVDFAKRHKLLPAGTRIEKTRPYKRDLRIVLIHGQHPNTTTPDESLPRIEVPAHVDRLHSLLATLSNPAETWGVSKECTPRALRIVHALLVETERRGYEVAQADDGTTGFEIRINGQGHPVMISEEWARREVLPTAEELAQTKVYSWQRFRPVTKLVSSGRLALELTDKYPFQGRKRRWADRQRWSLEDKLGEVLAEIEARAHEAEQRRLAEEEARQRRQRDWEAAIARARDRFREDRRIKALTEQISAWEMASKIRAYSDALDMAVTDDAAAAENNRRWMAWCRAYAHRLDPTGRGNLEPDDTEPTPEDLRPYLGRWSPYGPHQR